MKLPLPFPRRSELMKNPAAITEKQPINPYKVYGLLAVMVTSGGMMVTGRSPVTLEDSLTVAGQFLWALFGIISAGSVLVGVFWPNRPAGLLIEIPGLALLGVSLILYSVSVFIQVQYPYATLGGPLVASFGLACWHRIYQIVLLHRQAVVIARGRRIIDTEDGL